jgi:hypothetical protein
VKNIPPPQLKTNSANSACLNLRKSTLMRKMLAFLTLSVDQEVNRRASRLVGGMLSVGLLLAGPQVMAETLPEIGVCDNCSTAGFAFTAEQAVPPFIGNHPVYVLDGVSGEVRYFDVSVWWDCGGNNPQSVGSKGDAVSMDPLAGLQSNCIHKSAVSGVGNTDAIRQIEDAYYDVLDLLQPEGLTVDSGDLLFPGDSAIDLVGPDGSVAEYNRANLRNSVADHLEGWYGRVMFGWADLARRTADRLIGGSDFIRPMTEVQVNYPDGTTIRLEVLNVSSGPTGKPMVSLRIIPGSARLPNGQAVPFGLGQFAGFQFEGSEDVVQALFDLANLHGIPITGPGGGATRISCINDQHGVTCLFE